MSPPGLGIPSAAPEIRQSGPESIAYIRQSGRDKTVRSRIYGTNIRQSGICGTYKTVSSRISPPGLGIPSEAPEIRQSGPAYIRQSSRNKAVRTRIYCIYKKVRNLWHV